MQNPIDFSFFSFLCSQLATIRENMSGPPRFYTDVYGNVVAANAFLHVGAGMRKIVLRIVAALSLLVNLVFAIATLAKPLSLYTLLVYSLMLAVIGVLLEQTAIDRGELRAALASDVYPALIRTPAGSGFTLYVGAWLAWWIVSQLFSNAGVVFERNIVSTIVLVPLVLAALASYAVYTVKSKTRRALLFAVRIATLVVLFFPTRSWAPQYNSALATSIRATLFFVALLVLDSLKPPQLYADVDNFAQDRSTDQERAELAQVSDERQRSADAILDAHRRIDTELDRQREFVSLTAWILVTPLVVAGLLFPLALVSFFYSIRPKAHVARPAHDKRRNVQREQPETKALESFNPQHSNAQALALYDANGFPIARRNSQQAPAAQSSEQLPNSPLPPQHSPPAALAQQPARGFTLKRH